MIEKISRSDQLEDPLINFAARIVNLVCRLPSKDFTARHIANPILRSGTSGAANYAEARSAESRADFIHKMRVVEKELNETGVWLRAIQKISLLPPALIVEILAENKELARITSASVRTARMRGVASSDED
jgi:four helix bundle protein